MSSGTEYIVVNQPINIQYSPLAVLEDDNQLVHRHALIIV
jgi:hypothetical protein